MTREEIAEANKAFWKRKRASILVAPKPKTIAQELHGKLLEEYSGAVQYDPQTGIYTFPDGSEAQSLTTFERLATIDAFVATDLSTQSLKRIKKWMSI